MFTIRQWDNNATLRSYTTIAQNQMTTTPGIQIYMCSQIQYNIDTQILIDTYNILRVICRTECVDVAIFQHPHIKNLFNNQMNLLDIYLSYTFCDLPSICNVLFFYTLSKRPSIIMKKETDSVILTDSAFYDQWCRSFEHAVTPV